MRLRRPNSAHLSALRGLRAPSMWLFRCPAGPPEASRAGTITGSDSHPCEGAAEPWPSGCPRSCAVRAGLGARKARGRQVAPPGPRSGPRRGRRVCESLANRGLRSAAWARGAGRRGAVAGGRALPFPLRARALPRASLREAARGAGAEVPSRGIRARGGAGP